MSFGHTINHPVHIHPSDNNGFIVKVGCGRFVYQSKTDLLSDLRVYLAEPQEMEKQYNDSCGGDGRLEPAAQVEEGQDEPQPVRSMEANATRG